MKGGRKRWMPGRRCAHDLRVQVCWYMRLGGGGGHTAPARVVGGRVAPACSPGSTGSTCLIRQRDYNDLRAGGGECGVHGACACTDACTRGCSRRDGAGQHPQPAAFHTRTRIPALPIVPGHGQARPHVVRLERLFYSALVGAMCTVGIHPHGQECMSPWSWAGVGGGAP